MTVSFSFPALIDPIDREEFIVNYWEKDYLLLNRKDPDYYSSLMLFSDVDRCLEMAADTYRDVLCIVPPPGSGREQKHYRGIDISMKQVYQAFHSGDTINVRSAHRLWPSLASLATELSEALSARVGINIYMTPANSQGFGVHFDTHDGFILQVDGSKDWYIYEPYHELPTETSEARHYIRTEMQPQPVAEDSLIEQVRLRKGDLLYIPRGFPHKAVACEEPSLHLTAGVFPLYWMDFIKAAIEAVGFEQPSLRRGLPPGFVNDPEVRARMAESFQSLLSSAGKEAEKFFNHALETMIGYRMNTLPYPGDGHLEQLTKLHGLTVDSVVRRRSGLECLVVNSDNSMGITFFQNEIRGPMSTRPALEYIRDQRRFRVGDLPGLDDKSKLVLTRRLIREGLLSMEARLL